MCVYDVYKLRSNTHNTKVTIGTILSAQLSSMKHIHVAVQPLRSSSPELVHLPALKLCPQARAEAAAGARLASGPRVGPAEPDAVPGAAEKMVPSGPGPATRRHE